MGRVGSPPPGAITPFDGVHCCCVPALPAAFLGSWFFSCIKTSLSCWISETTSLRAPRSPPSWAPMLHLWSSLLVSHHSGPWCPFISICTRNVMNPHCEHQPPGGAQRLRGQGTLIAVCFAPGSWAGLLEVFNLCEPRFSPLYTGNKHNMSHLINVSCYPGSNHSL